MANLKNKADETAEEQVNDPLLQETLEKIGLQLMELRKELGYSNLEEFAHDHGIPRVQYWRIEKGKANLTLKSLHRLLAIHKIPIADFFTMIYKENKK